MSAQPTELRACLCGREALLFRFYDDPSEPGAHINIDCSGYASDQCPLNLSLTANVSSERDVERFLFAWNARAPAPALLDKIERLESALGKIDEWCCPLLCSNCRDNRETARLARNNHD